MFCLPGNQVITIIDLSYLFSSSYQYNSMIHPDPLSDNESDLVPEGNDVPVLYHQHYADVESEEVEESPDSRLQSMESETKPIKVNSLVEDHQFKLRLPSRAENQDEEGRNKSRQGRHGKIRIEGQQKEGESNVRASKKEIKIYDIGDEREEVEEDLTEILNDSIQKHKEIIPIRVTPSKLQQHEEIEENHSSTFLDLKDHSPKKVVPFFEIPKVCEEKVTLQVPARQHKPRIMDGAVGRTANVKQNMFFNEKKEEIDYEISKVTSKDSLQSGLQMNHSSRDELSSRVMIDSLSPERKKRRLPSLKPMNELFNRKEEKIYSLKTYDNVNRIQERHREQRLLANGKYAILMQDIEDKDKFIRQPVPFDKCLQTTLIRNKGCSKMGYLDYDLETNDGLYLLSCKKMPFHLGSTYHISLEKKEFSESSDLMVGRLQGNFIGSLFNLHSTLPSGQTGSQLEATVYYSPEWTCCKISARSTQIYIKNKSFKFQELEGASEKKNLKELYEVQSNKSFKKIHKYVNKTPTWVPERETFAMNFRGKVRYASVKNMIFVNADNPGEQGLLLAKKDQNEFNFDILYPFTPLIGLGVAMTSFDFKLASQ